MIQLHQSEKTTIGVILDRELRERLEAAAAQQERSVGADAGVSAFYVLAPGYLVLLARPNSEKVVSERLGDLPRGYQASPDLKIRQPWMPGLEPARPHR